jgi:hypothetical protein
MTNIKKIKMVWDLEVLNAWAISNVKMTLVLCLSIRGFIIKSTRAATHLKFLLLGKLSWLFPHVPLLVRFMVLPPFVCKYAFAACIVWFILCRSFK